MKVLIDKRVAMNVDDLRVLSEDFVFYEVSHRFLLGAMSALKHVAGEVKLITYSAGLVEQSTYVNNVS